MMEIHYPMENLIIDPLVLTVSAASSIVLSTFEAIRTLQFAWDLRPPTISVGLSNVSNAVPREEKDHSIDRVYCAMLMGVGMKMMIADPLDAEQMKSSAS